MAVPLADYVRVKDNYCIAYLGVARHAVDKLIYNRTKLEALYPGVQIYICAHDQLLDSMQPNVIALSELDIFKKRLAFIREVNDVEEFLQESGLTA
jgi:hypothetical protein